MDVETFRADVAERGYGDISEVEWPPGTVNESHTHEFAAALLVVEGAMSVSVDSRTVACAAGDRFSLDAGVPHAERVGPEGVRFLVARRAGAAADGSCAARARYFDSSVAFNVTNPPVPCRQFTAERDRAFDAATGSAVIEVDQSAEMALDFPATTPLVLASYLRIAAGERLPFDSRAGTELYFAIRGAGESRTGGDVVPWAAGDAFALPGGGPTEHRAAAGEDSVLWAVTNAPALALDGLAPPPPDRSPVQAVRFPAAEIAERMTAIRPKLTGTRTPGIAVIFASAAQEHRRNVAPGLTFAMNQLPPGGMQLPHRHNSVAVSLAIHGPQCCSIVDGERADWEPWGTIVTPPGAVHAHCNESDEWAHWLIAQDGGYHYHCRTMDFRYADGAA